MFKGYLDVCNCSFPACYGAEFCPIPDAMDGGVPLEHLISCVPGIQIQVSSSGVKKIQWAENKPPSQIGLYFMLYFYKCLYSHNYANMTICFFKQVQLFEYVQTERY